jgi:hypothetical protein
MKRRILVLAVLPLLGSASLPRGVPLLPVDPAVAEWDGCPEGAGDSCILLSDDQGEIVLAGLPQALAPNPEPAAPRLMIVDTSNAAPALAPLRVVISLPQQKAFVFRRGALVASAPVSTGRPGHPTPVGTFRILQKKVHHKSNIYSDAPMPFMQRLTNYGIALHAGALPGYPASHGCIRLPWNFARKLYGMTDGSTLVTITREKVSPGRPA